MHSSVDNPVHWRHELLNVRASKIMGEKIPLGNETLIPISGRCDEGRDKIL